jgi:predicted cobalt transporter CbtA
MKRWAKNSWARACAAFTLLFAMLSQVPYDSMGSVAMIVPQRWKTPAFVTGAVLFVVFHMLAKPKPDKIEEKILRIYHHYPKSEE